MNQVSGPGASVVGYTGDAGNMSGLTVVSPDALLAFCRMQLGDLDAQVRDQLNTQRLALKQRTAVQSVQTALEKFGDQGPQSADELKTCDQAFQDAIQSLDKGDPVAAQLQTKVDEMNAICSTKGPAAGTVAPVDTRHGDGQTLLGALAPTALANGTPADLRHGNPTSAATEPPSVSSPASSDTSFKKADSGQWKGTIDGVQNIADHIKSNAEIHMLTLQDLVSQRQQAVALATGIMSKEDQTLADGAKAIGQ